jgi:hypothetical protein
MGSSPKQTKHYVWDFFFGGGLVDSSGMMAQTTHIVLHVLQHLDAHLVEVCHDG